MRRSRMLPITATVTLLLGARAASAQTEPLRCAPTIELGASLPPRVAQRLRRVLEGAVEGISPSAPCAPSRARLEWNDHELTVRIALDDGRIAVRNLESLEDVLPTLLSVLAVPAPDPRTAVEAAPETLPVAPTPAPAPSAALAPAVPPVAAPPVARGASGWSVTVSLNGGASVQEGGDAMARWGGEVGAATPRLALSARAWMAYASAHDEADRSVSDLSNPTRRRRPSESGLVVSARARLGSGRLRLEVGGFGGAAHEGAGSAEQWLPRFGLETSLNLQFTRSLAAFVRAEGYVDIGGERGPGVALTVGATWEPMR
jgi:hypothetical protein